MTVTEKKDGMHSNQYEMKKVMDKWGMKMQWGNMKVMTVGEQDRREIVN